MPEHVTMTPAPPMRRSRNGCIDCRRAKVKCDEIRPSCGTCARRRHVCQGYAKPPSANSALQRCSPGRVASRSSPKPATPGSVSTPSARSPAPSRGDLARVTAASAASRGMSPARSDAGGSTPGLHNLVGSLSLIPRGAVPPADESNIEIYFKRHPCELLMGDEFVNEMNANVLLVLQHDPVIMADALSAIGYAYQAGDSSHSLMLVLNRRARILTNLRNLKPSSCYFEQALFLLLVLCAMELVTLAQPGHEATIPTVLSNVASLIGHHLSTGGEISFVGRYLLRALARQDLVVSLVQLRRPRVPTYAWLNLNESSKADRLLGYTATLMPLLEELCGLAEEVREQILNSQPRTDYSLEQGAPLDESLTDCLDLWLTTTPSPSTTSDFQMRAESLRHRLSTWRPTINDSLPFKTTRKFRAQAASYRAGALLYLHRLQHPPQQPPVAAYQPTSPSYFDSIPGATLSFGLDSASSIPTPAFPEDLSGSSAADAEAEALSKAHDIMLYVSGPTPAETKLLLWPVFLAACEMSSDEDRDAVREAFASITSHRGTVTVERTRRFVEERVWRARDAGEEWNWMVLAQRYPGECLPI